MCAQFEINLTAFNKTLIKFNIEPQNLNFKTRIAPRSLAPTFYLKEGKIRLELMNFSLIPSWSKDNKPKFVTFNARQETLLNRPAWKKPFLRQRCLVPISSFVEPVYEGLYAGNMVKFTNNDEDCLLAAGIWDEREELITGEIIKSFAIITRQPYPFVNKMGVERNPVFLPEKVLLDWVDTEIKDPEKLYSILNAYQAPNLIISIDRPLKAGWESRN